MEEEWKENVGFSLRSGKNETFTISKTTTGQNTTALSENSSSLILDIFSIMKSSQAISEEIKVSSLLEKMLNILIENAGAENGIFLVNRKEGLFVEARMDSKIESIKTDLNIPIEKFEEIPRSIINYVLRTKENLVIGDASTSPLFKMDPFIINEKIKSIFCMPIMYQGKLFGILYLENNLTSNAFSESRTQIVNLLSSQISISLNNAILYSEMEKMAKSFSRFVPGQFLEFLGKKSIQDISAGDAMPHNMTILFSDIRDFTSSSEKMNVGDNFGFLNSYMKRMGPLIQKNNGFIDKFIGDAIMALFPEQPETGIKAIIDMKIELINFNKYRESKGYIPIKIGIGLHTGQLILGTLGSEHRMDTTVIGDSVNLASRLEGLTKVLGVQGIVSETVFRSLPENNKYNFREIGNVQVKGKEIPIKIFEILDGDSKEILEKKLGTLQEFSLGLYFFQERNFQSAKSIFESILKKSPDDTPVLRYFQSSENFINNPPPQYWGGSLDQIK